MKTMMRAELVAATIAVVCLYGQSFTMADVHAVAGNASSRTLGVPQSGRFEMHGATMVDLIRAAWNVDADRVIGGPNWLESDRFDVIAQAPAGSSGETMHLMLRALLTDRFKLIVHDNTRELTAFTMTVAKGGVKMKKSDGAGEGGCAAPPKEGQGSSGMVNNNYVCRAMTMAELATFLPQQAPAYFRGTPLVDQTHLDGGWDFNIQWTSKGMLARAGDGIALFDGTEKQLGLHIELGKAPLPVIVVDSVNEKPTENAPGISEKLPQAPKEFEVAVIKQTAPGSTQARFLMRDARVDLQGLTLKNLIMLAWNLPLDDRIAGLPGFADNDHYDVTGKAPDGAGNDPEILRTMAQALLKDRFKIVSHEENRPIEVLLLEASKPKLKKADPANRSRCQSTASTSLVLTKAVECQNATMAQFAAWIGDNVGGYVGRRAVLDSTGLEGGWDFALAFSNPLAAAAAAAAGPDGGPPDPNGALTLFDALEKQLGLKLESAKRPMPVMVVDHIEQRPTEN